MQGPSALLPHSEAEEGERTRVVVEVVVVWGGNDKAELPWAATQMIDL